METFISPAFYLAENIISRGIPKERFIMILDYFKTTYGEPERRILTDMMTGDMTYCVETEEYYRQEYIGELDIDDAHSMIFLKRTRLPAFKYHPQDSPTDHIRQRIEYVFHLPSARLHMEILVPYVQTQPEESSGFSYSFKLHVEKDSHDIVQELVRLNNEIKIPVKV